MFTILFSLMFGVFTDVIAIMARSDDNEDRSVWFMVVVLVGTLLSYMTMYTLVTRFALVKVLSVSSAVAGCIHCLLSFTASFYSVTTVLLALSHGILAVAIVVSIAYVMEIVPTAVRGVALCWGDGLWKRWRRLRVFDAGAAAAGPRGRGIRYDCALARGVAVRDFRPAYSVRNRVRGQRRRD
ncbi:hypothetical protein MTO96_019440 [Rhipicephalus appendiculatus]